MGDSSDEDDGQECEYTSCISESVCTVKDLVHKCNSDPGGITNNRNSPCIRAVKYPIAGVTRKCVLTLDGYSYVIGKFIIIMIVHYP